MKYTSYLHLHTDFLKRFFKFIWERERERMRMSGRGQREWERIPSRLPPECGAQSQTLRSWPWASEPEVRCLMDWATKAHWGSSREWERIPSRLPPECGAGSQTLRSWPWAPEPEVRCLTDWATKAHWGSDFYLCNTLVCWHPLFIFKILFIYS